MRNLRPMSQAPKHPLEVWTREQQAAGRRLYELAAELGVTREHWHRLMTGACKTTPARAKQLQEMTGISWETFLDFDAEHPPARPNAPEAA